MQPEAAVDERLGTPSKPTGFLGLGKLADRNDTLNTARADPARGRLSSIPRKFSSNPTAGFVWSRGVSSSLLCSPPHQGQACKSTRIARKRKAQESCVAGEWRASGQAGPVGAASQRTSDAGESLRLNIRTVVSVSPVEESRCLLRRPPYPIFPCAAVRNIPITVPPLDDESGKIKKRKSNQSVACSCGLGVR